MKRMRLTLFLSGLNGILSSLSFAQDQGGMVSEGLVDVRGPVYLPTNYFLLWSIVAGVLIAGLAVFVFLRRKRKDEVVTLPLDTRTAWEIAYEQFAQLGQSSYLREGQFKEYYSELSGIIRLYFENRFDIRAPEMTTEEFLWSLERSKELKTDQKETLQKFMTSCDIIKFAKHIPRVEEAEDSFQFARKLVEETKPADAV